MKPGKPADGFRIIVSPVVQAMADDVFAEFPEDEWRWLAVIARLRTTGHVEGEPVGSGGMQRAGTLEIGDWKVVLAWRINFTSLTIMNAMF